MRECKEITKEHHVSRTYPVCCVLRVYCAAACRSELCCYPKIMWGSSIAWFQITIPRSDLITSAVTITQRRAQESHTVQPFSPSTEQLTERLITAVWCKNVQGTFKVPSAPCKPLGSSTPSSLIKVLIRGRKIDRQE